MSLLDIVTTILGLLIGSIAAKRYAKDLFPESFFHEPKHQKKSTIRKWLERAAFFVLGGD